MTRAGFSCAFCLSICTASVAQDPPLSTHDSIVQRYRALTDSMVRLVRADQPTLIIAPSTTAVDPASLSELVSSAAVAESLGYVVRVTGPFRPHAFDPFSNAFWYLPTGAPWLTYTLAAPNRKPQSFPEHLTRDQLVAALRSYHRDEQPARQASAQSPSCSRARRPQLAGNDVTQLLHEARTCG